MALCQLNFRSKILGMCTEIQVILPEVAAAGGKPIRELPVLYLLHGLSDDATAWTRYTSIERYALARDLCVVMPNGGRSFYVDMAQGARYYTYLSRELPLVVERAFGMSRERNLIAGLSMGGYGAFRHALGRPEQFVAAGSFSGALNVRARVGHAIQEGLQIYGTEMAQVFGTGEENDVFRLLQQADPASLPPLYQSCGLQDGLLEENRTFCALAQQHGVNLTYREAPGSHEWAFWDSQIVQFLDWAMPYCTK